MLLPNLQISAIFWEFGLGMALISGKCNQVTWTITLLTFVAFSAVSLSLALAGYSTCNCFGSFSMSPWLLFAMDGLIVAVIFTIRPLCYRRAVMCIAAIATFATAMLFTVRQLPKFEEFLSVVETTNVSGQLDEIEQNSYHEWIFELRNTSSETIRILDTQSSCTCLGFSFSTFEVLAGQTCSVTARLDLTLQPTFVGDLRLKGAVTSESSRNIILIFDKNVRVLPGAY